MNGLKIFRTVNRARTLPHNMVALLRAIRYNRTIRGNVMMDNELSYAEFGAGSPLVLLHGNGEDRNYFEAQISPFATRYRVIAVDTRGHGQSPRGSEPFTLSQFADDLYGLLDRLSIDQTDILGFSDGGNIALLFALRHPLRVKRLVLNGANLYPGGMKLLPWLAIDALYIGACFTSLFCKGTRHKRELLGLMATQPHIHPEVLRLLAMPVLVIAGTHDLIRDSHTRLIARSLPQSTLVLLEGGHCIAQKKPEAYNQAVLAFLAEP